MAKRQLARPRQGKMIAGVCAGLADFYGFNVTLVRLLFVIFGLFGPGEIAYVIIWVLAPKQD